MTSPLFQHRHYAEIARIISEVPDEARAFVVQHFAAELMGSNPRFDIERFRAAANGKPKTRKDAR